jgi:hypothetical protein
VTFCTGSGLTPGKCEALPREPASCAMSNECLAPARCNATKTCVIDDPGTCE